MLLVLPSSIHLYTDSEKRRIKTAIDECLAMGAMELWKTVMVDIMTEEHENKSIVICNVRRVLVVDLRWPRRVRS